MKRRLLGVGMLVLLSVGGVAAVAVPTSATPASVSSRSSTVIDPGVEDGSNDGETADDQAGERPGQETADEQGVEDGTNDGETADEASVTPAP